MAADAEAYKEAGQAIGTAGIKIKADVKEIMGLWEDVYVGYMLSKLKPAPRLALVGIDWDSFFERWGFEISASSLVWHAKMKDPSRLPLLQAWKDRHHCSRRGVGVKLKTYGTTCTGGIWPRFTEEQNATCEPTVADLKSVYRLRRHANGSAGASSVPDVGGAGSLRTTTSSDSSTKLAGHPYAHVVTRPRSAAIRSPG